MCPKAAEQPHPTHSLAGPGGFCFYLTQMSLVRETVEKNSSGWPTRHCQRASWRHELPGARHKRGRGGSPTAEMARPPSKGEFCSQAEVVFPFNARQHCWQPFHGLPALWMPRQTGQVCQGLPSRLTACSRLPPQLSPPFFQDKPMPLPSQRRPSLLWHCSKSLPAVVESGCEGKISEPEDISYGLVFLLELGPGPAVVGTGRISGCSYTKRSGGASETPLWWGRMEADASRSKDV